MKYKDKTKEQRIADQRELILLAIEDITGRDQTKQVDSEEKESAG